MDDFPYLVLSSSRLGAAIHPFIFTPGSFTLQIDDVPQSHVNLDNPGLLFFEYIQRMGHVIDAVAVPGQPITALHLGGGALTLPRYIAHTRPGSEQHVVEIEADLVGFVLENLPLAPNCRADLHFHTLDAREALNQLPTHLHGSVDVIIVDIFSGAHTPEHVTTVEFFTAVAKFLSPDGVMLVNVMDGVGLEFARAQSATLARSVPSVTALTNAYTFALRDSGNVVLVGSGQPLANDWTDRLLAGGPHPATVVSGLELSLFIADTPAITDQTIREKASTERQPAPPQ